VIGSELRIRGATVYDGTGQPGRRASVTIAAGRIVAVEPDDARPGSGAGQTIDAAGLALAPGFIDLHSHADMTLPAFPAARNSLAQGVTTEVVGNCGFSPAPVPTVPALATELREYVAGLGPTLDWQWTDFASYLTALDAARPAVNVIPLVGHGTLRIGALGMEDRAPTPTELAHMREHLAASLAGGAWGLSSGLVYPPGAYAVTDELVSIGEPLRAVDGLYASHIRNEGDQLVDAVDEALTIGRELGVRTQVSHLKSSGAPNHGRIGAALARLEAARAAGQRAWCDVYPYTAGSTFLSQVLPPWAHAGGVDALLERLRSTEQRQRIRHDLEHGLPGWGNHARAAGGWHNIIVASVATPAVQSAEGRRVDELAAAAGLDPLDFVADLLIRDRAGTVMVLFLMAEPDVAEALASPTAVVGSDQLGVVSDTARVHPRAYGTFVKVLGWGVRDARLFDLPTAVHKMSGASAELLGLRDRGRVAPGLVADLVLFDPATVGDQSTYEAPTRGPRGVEYVLVNGQLAVDRGEVVNRQLGQVLRRP
jgi:N-acyl-D-aspartate/D-glutamate deacylase